MADISLIRNWHEKAKEDYFSRYIFEYLAFEAFLKKYRYTEDEMYSLAGNTRERSYIQRLKTEEHYSERWGELLSKQSDLKTTVNELIEFLMNEPLRSDSNWWNCTMYDRQQCDDKEMDGVIASDTDFINIIEFWYQVRNNLFHGGKNPDSKRDEQLVTFGYLTLSIFMEDILLPEMEESTLYPAIWEEFEHKFFNGEAEVTFGKSQACANVYELLFMDEKYFPVLLNDKQINRDYVISKLSSNLTNLYGDETLFQKEWERITRQANTLEKKENLKIYFSDIEYYLKELIPGYE